MSYFSDAQEVFEVVVGQPSPWRWPRIIIGAVLAIIVGVLWKCSEIVGPDEQAFRNTFGRTKFRYYDKGGDTRWKRFKERRENRLAIRKLRKSSDPLRFKKMLDHGEPIIYGPGRYLRIPFTHSFIKGDATANNIQLSIFVQWPGQFRGADQSIELLVGVINFFLWKTATNDVLGTLPGVSLRLFKHILAEEDMGADRFIIDDEEVERRFKDLSNEIFPDFGAEAMMVNMTTPVPRTEGWIAQAIMSQDSEKSQLVNAIAASTVTNGDQPTP